MATFAQWLKVQLSRQDDVGQFARLWETMEGRPRLSSPTGIWKYLEGFAEKDQMRPFYEAALAEYQSGPRLGGEATVTQLRPGQEPPEPPPLPVKEIYKPPGMQDPAKLPPPPAWQPRGDPARALTDLGSINAAFAEVRAFMRQLGELLGLGGTQDRWMELYAKVQSARDNVQDGTEAAIVLETVSRWMTDADGTGEPEPEPGPSYDWQQVYAATDWTDAAGAGA